MFKWNRILVALIGVPLLVFIYTNKSFYGIPLAIFSFFIVGVGLYEFYNMIKQSGREVYSKLGIVGGLLIVLIRAVETSKIYTFSYTQNKELTVLGIVTIAILVHRVLINKIKGSIEAVATTILGIIYVSIFFSEIILLYSKTYPSKFSYILIIQILVWMSDTAAGVVGVSIGRKFFKEGFTEISPKKSVEGAIGSLIFTGLTAVIIAFILNAKALAIFNNYNYFMIFILGLIIAIVAQIGDLVESLFKRECGIKDSGTILMGHGGILDRFDSMLLVLPFCSFLINLFY